MQGSAQLIGCTQYTKGHFIVGRPDQADRRITRQQSNRLLVCPLFLPLTMNRLHQLDMRCFTQGTLQAGLTQS